MFERYVTKLVEHKALVLAFGVPPAAPLSLSPEPHQQPHKHLLVPAARDGHGISETGDCLRQVTV